MVLGLLCLCSSYSNAQTVYTKDQLDPSAQNWSGQYGTGYWQGQGGPDPNRLPDDTGFVWSSGSNVISTTIAINQALKNAGVQVNGYTYKWKVKNGNGNLFGNQPGTDDFIITVDVYDSNGNIYSTYQYDYSYQHNWTTHTGSETFVDPFLPPSYFSDIIVSAQGSDSAGWQGHYGPEFNVTDSELDITFSTNPCYQNPLYDPQCQGYAQALFDQQCATNALYDPSCPGYAAAYLIQQCAANPIYDASCSGYESAYLIQQCTADPLYDTSCEGHEAAQCDYDPLYSVTCIGYQQAYYEQQCSFDPQYDEGCNGYLAELDFDVDAENLDYDTTINSPAYVVEGQPNVYETNNLPLFEPVYEQDSVQQEPEMLDLDSAMLELEDDIEAEIAQLESESVDEEEIEDDIEAEIAALEETETEEVVLTPGGEEIVEDDIEAEIASLEESAEEPENTEKTSTISTKQDKMKELIAKKAVQTTKELEEAITLEQTIDIQRRLLALISYVPEFKQYYPKEVNQVAFYPPKPTVDHSYSRWFLNDPKYSQLENLQYSQQLK